MRRAFILGVSASAVALITVAPVIDPLPRIVYNASESAPLGFYIISREPPKKGDLVLVKPPENIETWLWHRGYLPRGIPILKSIYATKGDQICRSGLVITLNGGRAVEALEEDSLGSSLPRWEGCFRLGEGQVFLLQMHPRSLDGRYFGPLQRSQIIGKAIPLFLIGPKSAAE